MVSTPHNGLHASPHSKAYSSPSSPATFGLEPMTPAHPQQQQHRHETEVDKVMKVYLNSGRLTPEHMTPVQPASSAAAAAASPTVAAAVKVLRCQVAKARNLPDSHPGAAALITVRLGSSQVQTKKATPAGAPQWHESFDLSLDSPSTIDDMATFLLRRVTQGATDDGTHFALLRSSTPPQLLDALGTPCHAVQSPPRGVECNLAALRHKPPPLPSPPLDLHPLPSPRLA